MGRAHPDRLCNLGRSILAGAAATDTWRRRAPCSAPCSAPCGAAVGGGLMLKEQACHERLGELNLCAARPCEAPGGGSHNRHLTAPSSQAPVTHAPVTCAPVTSAAHLLIVDLIVQRCVDAAGSAIAAIQRAASRGGAQAEAAAAAAARAGAALWILAITRLRGEIARVQAVWRELDGRHTLKRRAARGCAAGAAAAAAARRAGKEKHPRHCLRCERLS